MQKAAVCWAMLGALALSAGCAGLVKTPLALPEGHSLVREQLNVYSDFPLATRHRLIEELTARRYDLSRRLDLPPSNEPIHIYLFDSDERFRAFMRMKHPEFPSRRAFFIETDTRLIVYAHWGDRVAEDLRHEVTHGYLHAMAPQLPLWLDEGLAEYFEAPRGREGYNRSHLDRLRARLGRGEWRPDLARIERLDAPFDMTQDDYAEAWAWVHFLLHASPAHTELLQGYLDDWRRNGTAEPLSQRMGSMLDVQQEALVDHIRRLGSR